MCLYKKSEVKIPFRKLIFNLKGTQPRLSSTKAHFLGKF